MESNAELTESYQAVRDRCIEIGRSLTAEQAATMSPCCPEWSVKDLFAHLVGVAVDVLEGNLEGAATPPWADAHVARRADDSLSQILDEWEASVEKMDGLLDAMALDIDRRFFLDCWTHEWDVRQALDLPALPDLRIPTYLLPKIGATLNHLDRPSDGMVIVHVETSEGVVDITVGSGEPVIEATMSLFDLMRVVVGRRSSAQIANYGADIAPDRLVYFEANAVDIVDPIIA